MPRLTGETSNDMRSAQDASRPTMLSHTTNTLMSGLEGDIGSLMHNCITAGTVTLGSVKHAFLEYHWSRLCHISRTAAPAG